MEQVQINGTFFPPNEKIIIQHPAITISTKQNGSAGGNLNDENKLELTKSHGILIQGHSYESGILTGFLPYSNDEDGIGRKKRFAVPPGTGSHQCVFCGARFTSAANMNRHRKRHFNIKAFKCCICQKDFGRRDHLTQHLEIHIKTKPFTCAVCNETFDAREILKDHLISKHIDNNPEDRICKLCGHESQTSRGAKLHYTSRHFNNRLMIGELPHGCDPSSEVSAVLAGQDGNNSNNNQLEETNDNHQPSDAGGTAELDKFTTRRTPRKDKNPTKVVTGLVEDNEEEDEEDEDEDELDEEEDEPVQTFVQQVSPDVILTQCDDDYVNNKDLNYSNLLETKCEACGIIFPDRTLYFLHKGFHTELDPWKCNICGVKCRDKYDFHVHLLSKAHN